MSDFPRLRYLLDESTCESMSGHEPVRATNGALHVRRHYTTEKRTWQLAFMLEADGREALQDHYDDHRDATFNFIWVDDGTTYSVSYASPPQYTRAGPLHSRARVTLMER